VKRREDITSPRRRRPRLGLYYDPDAFGEFSEAIARYLGTARFLVIQTGVCFVWVGWNYLAPRSLQFDPSNRGLVLLTLALSLQAAYAAPLILLAQNRQEARERGSMERDRELANRTQADTEYLARELAAVRLALGDVASQADLGELTKAIEALHERVRSLVEPGDDTTATTRAAS
jgi:uncharacterized membrane protein